MCQDGPQDFIGMGLDLLFIVAPGTLIFIIEKPFLGAQQVKDITQQDDCYLLDSAAFFGGYGDQVIEEIFEGLGRWIMLTRGAIHKMQIADKDEHFYSPWLFL